MGEYYLDEDGAIRVDVNALAVEFVFLIVFTEVSILSPVVFIDG